MRKSSRRSSALVAAAGLTVAVLLPTPAAAYTTTGCKYGNPGVGLEKGSMYSTDHDTALNRAQARWSSNTDVKISFVFSSSFDAYTENLNNVNFDGYSNWSCSGSSTLWSTSRLNTQTTPGFGTDKKATIWAHELGHGLGLNHTGGLAAIMYTSPGTAYNNYGTVLPTADDKAGMNYLY